MTTQERYYGIIRECNPVRDMGAPDSLHLRGSHQGDTRSLSGRLAAAFEEMAVDEKSLEKLEAQLSQNGRASAAVEKLVQNGIDKKQFLCRLFVLCKAYEEGKRRPLLNKNRGAYLAAVRRLAANLPDCHRLIEKWLLPLFDPSIRTPFLSQEAIAARSLAARSLVGTNRGKMFSDLKQLIRSLQELAPVVQQLGERRPNARYKKAESSLFSRHEQAIDAERPFTVRKERRARLESFCDWCTSNYSGKQLCGTLSPILNAAFDSFHVQIDYPNTAQNLRTFLRRRTTRLR